MKTTNLTLQELRTEEMREINGGFLFLLPIAVGLLVGAALLLPIAAAAQKGWEDAAK